MKKIDRPSLLVLVRHGESLRNKAKKGSVYFADDEARNLVAGIPDNKIPLTENGILEADAAGIYLRERFGAPDYLYHSGYVRTIQTADGILGAYSKKERGAIRVRMNPFIRERDSGHAYDMTVKEAEKFFPWLQEYWREFGGFLSRPPGGESLADLSIRVYLFLNMLFRDRCGMRVFVVTHGGTIRCFRFLLEHWDFDQALKWPKGQSPKNCGITFYEYDKRQKRLILQEYNTVAP